MDERSIPEAAIRDKNSIEILRAWIAERQLHCSVKVGFYQETAKVSESRAWGITLADVTKHIATALSEMYSFERNTIMCEIRDSFIKELDLPTSDASGEFKE